LRRFELWYDSARVRILIDYRAALIHRSGVGEYAHQMALALVPRLSTQDVLTLFSSSWKDRLPGNRVPGARVVDARVPVRLLNLAWHRLEWPPVEMLAGPCDVSHAMHPLLIPAQRSAQVITIHDLDFLDHPENTAAEIRRDYAALAARHASRADGVIANSQYTAREARARLNVPPDRITVCCPGAPAWPARESGPASGIILFIGTVEPRKNIPGLLAAYSRLVERLPDAPPLVLAGRAAAGAPELRPLGRPPLAGRARHIGYVTDEERVRLYREAVLLVVPSLNEGFGMPVLEAMTIGVPVIASNRGALPEVVGNAGLLFDPACEGALEGAIERILFDRALARRCTELGIERAATFTWRTSASRLVHAYTKAVAVRQART
jgi:glycosyltransferase involved in cell wall biosynthesis